LPARILHDPEHGTGQFEIGHVDRREGRIPRGAFQEITFPEGGRRVFEVRNETGKVRQIPFHRVREVYRDRQGAWQRPAP
jgi:hypothetical protein